MKDKNRVYFIGAGASKQDRFPLTSELKHGIAWAARDDSTRFGLLTDHLNHVTRSLSPCWKKVHEFGTV